MYMPARLRPGKLLIAALVMAAWSCTSTVAQEVQIYVSSQAGDRLAAKPSVHFEAGGAGPQALKFEINDGVTYQKIAGFGASFMEAGLMVINTLPAQQQEAVLRAMFDPQQGAGFTAMKTPIAGTEHVGGALLYL